MYADQQVVQKESKVVPSAAGSTAGMFALISVGFLAAGVLASVWKARRARTTRQVSFGVIGVASDLEDPLE
jgi:hypothetical protein